jgi:hypothetical protein
MNTRLYIAIGALALIFGINSAFACGTAHHTAHKTVATKVATR